MLIRFLSLCAFVVMAALVQAQDNPVSEPPVASDTTTPESPSAVDKTQPSAKSSTTDQLKKSAEDLTAKTEAEIKKIAVQVDKDPRATTAAAGILQPIYHLAESLAFPTFHWLAFALMTAGVASYALQLALGKVVVLVRRMGFSPKEIVSDAVGLAISLTGLVLTTQAAAENSTFTQSPAAVISATAVGAIAGIILYLWGQAQELQAAAGRSSSPVVKKR